MAAKSTKRNRTSPGIPRKFLRNFARAAIWIMAGLVVLAALWHAALAGRRWLFDRNDHFLLRRLDIAATGELTTDRIEELLDQHCRVRVGETNLFALDPGMVRQQLLQQHNGLLYDVTIVRRLPDTLQVGVYERNPAARLFRRDGHLIDPGGWVLPARPARSTERLPRITGIRGPGDYKPQYRTEDPLLLAALTFLELCQEKHYDRWMEVQLIRLDYPTDSLHVYLYPKGIFVRNAMIVVPAKDMEQAMVRVERVVRTRTKAQQPTKFIDGSYTNVPVKP